jgi:hypothetical protein
VCRCSLRNQSTLNSCTPSRSEPCRVTDEIRSSASSRHGKTLSHCQQGRAFSSRSRLHSCSVPVTSALAGPARVERGPLVDDEIVVHPQPHPVPRFHPRCPAPQELAATVLGSLDRVSAERMCGVIEQKGGGAASLWSARTGRADSSDFCAGARLDSLEWAARQGVSASRNGSASCEHIAGQSIKEADPAPRTS